MRTHTHTVYHNNKQIMKHISMKQIPSPESYDINNVVDGHYDHDGEDDIEWKWRRGR